LKNARIRAVQLGLEEFLLLIVVSPELQEILPGIAVVLLSKKAAIENPLRFAGRRALALGA
jgi:hypothetical protein